VIGNWFAYKAITKSNNWDLLFILIIYLEQIKDIFAKKYVWTGIVGGEGTLTGSPIKSN